MATSRKSQSQDLLVSVAESIGSTLGAIAAKADAAQKAIVGSTDAATKEVKRGATKLVRRGKRAVAKVPDRNQRGRLARLALRFGRQVLLPGRRRGELFARQNARQSPVQSAARAANSR